MLDDMPEFANLAAGDKAALASALGLIERAPDAAETLALLNRAYASPKAHVVGITGPPGVGKSTLIGALIGALRGRGRTVGVIAVDPSSRRSGGALLGDRTRIRTDPQDPGVFVRSMAARDRLGGLAGLTVAAMVLMRAAYDWVILETVGVGQSEADVAGAADTVVLCLQPGAGDSLQFMKAGLIEVPHIIAVTKADLGAVAERARADVEAALGLAVDDGEGWPVPVLQLSVPNGKGLDTLVEAVERHAARLAEDGRLSAARDAQARHWLAEAVRERYGREGVRRVGALTLASGESPFARLADIGRTLGTSLDRHQSEPRQERRR